MENTLSEPISTSTLWERINAFAHYLIPLGLFVFALLVYAKAMNNELLFSWDDNRYLAENLLIRDFPTHVPRIFTESYFAAYLPITILSYAIEYTLWGLNSTGYHTVNVFLHAINGVLVFFFTRRLQGRESVALIATLLFISHPIQSENVAWVSQRKSLLSLLFFLLCWLQHMRASQGNRGAGSMVLAWGLFILSVLSKPTAVGAGVLFMIYDYFWTEKKFSTIVWHSLPYWIIGIIGAVLIVVAHQEHNGIKGGVLDNLPHRTGVMLWVAWDYVVSLLNPFGLNNMYVYYQNQVTWTNPAIWLGLVVLVGLGAFAVFQPVGKPHSLFMVVWVVVMMLPVSNVIPIAIQRADRYMYFPSILIFLVVGIAAMWVWDRAAQVEWRYLLAGLAGGVLVCCIILTGERSDVWQNSDTLWADHLKTYPTSETGLLNRGVYFFRHQKFDTAADLFTELLRLYPNHYKGNRFMGIISQNNGDWEAAARYYNRAIALMPNQHDLSGNYGAVLIELGVKAFDEGDYAKALQLYEEATKFIPNEPILFNNIGFTLFNMQQYEASITAYDAAIALNPQYTRAWVNRGETALAVGNYALSRDSYIEAIALRANLDAKSLSNYCLAGAEMGDSPEIILPYCEEAVKQEAQNALYWGRTAHVLLLYGLPEQALVAAEQAINFNPNLALGFRTSGDAHAQLGNIDLARQAYIRTLELAPDNQAALEGLEQLN